MKETDKREGIGSKLVKHVIDPNKGITIKTEVLKENGPAMSFFEELGFQRLEEEGDQFLLKYPPDKSMVEL